MKKILPALALSVLLPFSALASVITLTPATVSTTAGKSFTVSVGVNPTSGKAYTVRANLSFDPSAVTLVGFTFAPKWIQLPQEGYDLEDNAGGKLVKTGGYPGGVTAATVLGTATFRAKTTGVTAISATGDSLILDAGNQNSVAGAQGSVQVSIASAATPTPSPVTAPATAGGEVKPVQAVAVPELAIATSSGVEVTQVGTAAVLSPFESAITFGTGSPAVAALVTLVALLVVGTGVWLWRRERSAV